jgi:hypothetical protein
MNEVGFSERYRRCKQLARHTAGKPHNAAPQHSAHAPVSPCRLVARARRGSGVGYDVRDDRPGLAMRRWSVVRGAGALAADGAAGRADAAPMAAAAASSVAWRMAAEATLGNVCVCAFAWVRAWMDPGPECFGV